jgi:hypothetical protein
VFVQQGGTLSIVGGSLGDANAKGGRAGAKATAGQAYGSAIFIQGDQSVTVAAPTGALLTINGTVADQTGAGGRGPKSGAGTLVVGNSVDSGMVKLAPSNGANTYTGGTMLAAGTLELTTVGAGGTGAITFAADANATLRVDSTAMPSNTIDGFATGDTINLRDVTYDPNGTATLNIATNSLTVTEGGHNYVLQFDPDQSFTGEYFHLANGAGTGVTVNSIACYARDTRILTDRGEIAVEALTIGDGLITAGGAVRPINVRPIKWIGRRCYAGRFLTANPDVVPVRFRAGSLGSALPRRDLLVSPEHAMFLGGVLIPARCLINGTTIVRARELARVDYYHVELDTHDVILAEGAPSETFMDDDSRGMFHNAAEYAELYPYAPEPVGYCAPRVEGGYQLEAIRDRLAEVASEMAQAA